MTIEVHQGNALTMHDDQPFWNDHQLAALRQIGVGNAGNGDLAVFHHVCQRTGLDPFARQIHMIERQGKWTIQTGIDGYRLVARRAVDRTHEALSILSAEWCGPDGKWVDVWLANEPPAAARVTVLRGQGTFTAVALYREYVQTKRDGNVTAMWAQRGAGQLAKCAEALALRKAFPQDLSGVYTDDEMGSADRGTHQAGVDPVAPAPQRMAAILGETEPDPVAPDESPYLDPKGQLAKRMFATLGDLGVNDRDDRLTYVSKVLNRPIASSSEMTDDDADKVIEQAEADLEQPFPGVGVPR